MHGIRLSFLLIVTLFLSISGYSQNAKAVELMNKGKYAEAANILSMDKSIESMENANLSALGVCYIQLRNYTDAESVYRELTSRKKTKPVNFMYLGEILLIREKYDESKAAFTRFLEDNPDNYRAKLKIRSCDSLQTWASHKSDITLHPAKFNSPEEEKSSFLYQENLVFVTNRIPEAYRDHEAIENNTSLGYRIVKNEEQLFHEDLFETYTCEAADYCPGTNTFAYTLRKKKKFMYETGFSTAGIFFRKTDSENDSLIAFQWEGMPENINIAHPAFSKKGTRLFFISDMPGGQGGNDIYYSDFKDGNWAKPVNAGENINTPDHEVFPVVSGDSVLYYASDGFPGYGNLDVYAADVNGDQFGTAVNMKAPINSVGNDYSYYPENPYEGYLSTNRSSLSEGKNDIFRHSRPRPEPEPEPEPEEEPLVFNPNNFNPQPVYFSIEDANIHTSAIADVKQIADSMKFYPEISIQIIGHAGSKGPKSLNTELAEERALAAKNKLVDYGIDASRIAVKNAGITKDRMAEGITCHVQLGSSRAAGKADWFASLIDNSMSVKEYRKGEYSIYYVGNFRDIEEANALKKELADKYDLQTLINYGSRDRLLGNNYHVINRRIEFDWVK